MTVSSNPGEATTTTTTANTAVSSTTHPQWKNYNTSGKTMRRRIEHRPTKSGNNIVCTDWHGRT